MITQPADLRQRQHNGEAEPDAVLSCMEIWGGSEAADDAVSAPGVDFWVHSHPHDGDAAGGDIHYVSVCGGGRVIRAALADVSGHGEIVADLAHKLRDQVRKHISTPDQSRFAQALNEEFSRLSQRGAFATAILATYFAPSRSIIVCNAGHPRPLLWRSAKKQWRLFDPGETQRQTPRALRNLPLGVIPGTSYEQRVLGVEEGDMLMLYTDALVEASQVEGELLGEEGLLEIVRALDWSEDHPEGLVRGVLDAVRGRRGGEDADDDVTIILLRQNGRRPDFSVAKRLGVFAKMLGLRKV